MGNVRTPRPIYKNGYVMEFYVENKQVFYKISKWDDEGNTLALLFNEKLDGQDPKRILESVMTEKESQSFSRVSKNC